MSENIRIITMRKDVPEGTISFPGFHLLNMGEQGKWLVDETHPGYTGCVRKAIKIAEGEQDMDRARAYKALPGWSTITYPQRPDREKIEREVLSKLPPPKKKD